MEKKYCYRNHITDRWCLFVFWPAGASFPVHWCPTSLMSHSVGASLTLVSPNSNGVRLHWYLPQSGVPFHWHRLLLVPHSTNSLIPLVPQLYWCASPVSFICYSFTSSRCSFTFLPFILPNDISPSFPPPCLHELQLSQLHRVGRGTHKKSLWPGEKKAEFLAHLCLYTQRCFIRSPTIPPTHSFIACVRRGGASPNSSLWWFALRAWQCWSILLPLPAPGDFFFSNLREWKEGKGIK